MSNYIETGTNRSEVTALQHVANSIVDAAEEIGESIYDGLGTVAYEIYGLAKSNLVIANSILSSAEKISDRLKEANTFQEYLFLKKQVREDEDWLYQNKLLKQFYDEIDLQTSTQPMHPFNNGTGYILTSMLVGYGNRVLDIVKTSSLVSNITPIAFLSKEASRYGIRYYWEDGNRYVFEVGNFSCVFKEKDADFIEKMIKKYATTSGWIHITFPNSQKLFDSMIEYFKEKEDTLGYYSFWYDIYQELNVRIKIKNFKIFQSILENYVRSKKCLLCSS